MFLQLSDDEQQFRDVTRKFLADSCPLPRVRELANHPDGFEAAWWRQGAELGWTSPLVSEELGGVSISGDGLHDLALVAYEMGQLVTPGPFVPTNVVAAALSRAGAPGEQRARLERLVSGEATAAWCLDEAGTGFGAEAVALEARAGDGGFRLSGTKTRVEAAGQADLFLVSARTGDGPIQLLVPADAPGLSVRPLESVDLVRRFGEVDFAGVAVPDAAVVGDPKRAAEEIEHQLRLAICLQLAETVGAMDRVFAFTTEWAFDRYSFGRPLASYQELKHRFADMKLWLEASKATTRAALAGLAEGADNASELVSAAKSYVGGHGPALVQDCVQMHGGIGVTWDHDIHLYLRRVTLNTALYGTPRQHRERLAAVAGL